MVHRSVVDREVGNIVWSWAVEGQRCTPEEITP